AYVRPADDARLFQGEVPKRFRHGPGNSFYYISLRLRPHPEVPPTIIGTNVKRALAALLILALAAAAGAFAWQAADREREYRDLLRRGDLAVADGQTFG